MSVTQEDPFENVEITEGTYHIYISFFRQAGLFLDPLLVIFLRDTIFHLCQLTPNTVRIVLSVAELNRCFGLSLGCDEIKFCFSLNRNEVKWNLKARMNSSSFVEDFASFHKGMYIEIIEITGAMEPDPINNPVPKQFSYPGVFIFLYFLQLDNFCLCLTN